MAAAIAEKPLLTARDLLAMPDDGVERWIIDGELWQVGMTVRDRTHSRSVIRTGKFLDNWLDQQPRPHGTVIGGEAGIRLSNDPETVVGVDVAFIPSDLLIAQTDETTIIHGVPLLIVEVLSPSDTMEQIDRKLEKYDAAGVPLVWLIDPDDRTVTIYRHGEGPEMVNVRQELSGEPHLPGFRVPVAALFE